MTGTIAVVIPCFRVGPTILDVIGRVGPEVTLIVVVDDCCPARTGEIVIARCEDPRLHVLRHAENRGVGAAVLTGMREAIHRGAEILVKIDGDGQIDPRLVPGLIAPIQAGVADYAKGNRFFFLSNAHQMPRIRLFGNLMLSFLTKLSSGYWNIMDPTNGFVAMHASVARLLPFDRIAPRFFFESDVLFHLGLLRAKVVDVPMLARYDQEESNLRVHRVLWPFLGRHLRNTWLRLLYRYFIRDFSLASLELVFGSALFLFGVLFGSGAWMWGLASGELMSTGTIMVAVVPLLIGFQLLLAFLNFDIVTMPREAIAPALMRTSVPADARESGADAVHLEPSRIESGIGRGQ